MLYRYIIVNFTTDCLEMTKKGSSFKGYFLAVNGLKRSILAKNRLTCILFILLFAENRKFVSLFVLQIFAFKLSKSSIIGRLDTIIRYQWPLCYISNDRLQCNANLQSLQTLITFDILIRDPQCYTFLESLGSWEYNAVSHKIRCSYLW